MKIRVILSENFNVRLGRYMTNYNRNRKVGEEASKMYLEYIDTGFFDKLEEIL